MDSGGRNGAWKNQRAVEAAGRKHRDGDRIWNYGEMAESHQETGFSW